MASYSNRFAQRLRKSIRAVGVGVASSTTEADADVPSITSGAGGPTMTTEPNGSIYLRTDSPSADYAIYARIGGSWVALSGS